MHLNFLSAAIIEPNVAEWHMDYFIKLSSVLYCEKLVSLQYAFFKMTIFLSSVMPCTDLFEKLQGICGTINLKYTLLHYFSILMQREEGCVFLGSILWNLRI